PAPVPHPGRAALADPDEPGVLQPLERLAHGVPGRVQLLREVALGRQRLEIAREDARAQVLVDAAGHTGCTSHQDWLYQWCRRTSTAALRGSAVVCISFHSHAYAPRVA